MEPVKMSLNLPAEEFNRLKEIASEDGDNMTSVVRKALKFYERYRSIRKDGGKIIESMPKFRDGSGIAVLEEREIVIL